MASGTQLSAKAVGRRIRELRLLRGWNQVDLEHHLGCEISQGALSHYETGRHLPSLKVLDQLARAFDVHPAVLLLDPARVPRDAAAAAVLCAKQQQVRQVLEVLGEESR
jgi:transcriptional regulator with XRE-family HTH domain